MANPTIRAFLPSPPDVLPPENAPERPIANVPTPDRVTGKDPLDRVIETDALAMHNALCGVAAAWSHASTVDEVCKLALTTAKMIQLRRRLLLLPDAAPSSKSSEGVIIPLD